MISTYLIQCYTSLLNIDIFIIFIDYNVRAWLDGVCNWIAYELKSNYFLYAISRLHWDKLGDVHSMHNLHGLINDIFNV